MLFVWLNLGEACRCSVKRDPLVQANPAPIHLRRGARFDMPIAIEQVRRDNLATHRMPAPSGAQVLVGVGGGDLVREDRRLKRWDRWISTAKRTVRWR